MAIVFCSVLASQVGSHSLRFSQKERIWVELDDDQGLSNGRLTQPSGKKFPPTATLRTKWNWKNEQNSNGRYRRDVGWFRILPFCRMEPLYCHPSKCCHRKIDQSPRSLHLVDILRQDTHRRQKTSWRWAAIPHQMCGSPLQSSWSAKFYNFLFYLIRLGVYERGTVEYFSQWVR